jgi:hypothetical protein
VCKGIVRVVGVGFWRVWGGEGKGSEAEGGRSGGAGSKQGRGPRRGAEEGSREGAFSGGGQLARHTMTTPPALAACPAPHPSSPAYSQATPGKEAVGERGRGWRGEGPPTCA